MNLNPVFSAALMLFLPVLGAIEPAIEFKLDEGEGVTLKSNLPELSGTVKFPENTRWDNGRAEGVRTLYFQGAPDKTRKGGHAAIPLTGKFDFFKPFTICFWMKPDKTLSRQSTSELISNVSGDRGPGFRILFSWNRLCFWTGDGQKNLEVNTNPAKFPIERDAWTHVAITADGAKGAVYLNGLLAAESKPETQFAVANTNRPLYVGSYNGGYAYNFNGSICDLKLFAQALTPAEVLAIAKDIAE